MKELSGNLTWEKAVLWFCSQKSNYQAVLDNYFDENVLNAAERFCNSQEFAETLNLLPKPPKRLLEIGSGRGIAAYAFAKYGFEVTALEPDPSNFVGSGAIKSLVSLSQIGISIKEEFGEELPFEDNTFDIAYVRQVLHHAKDLNKFCYEVQRVLVKNGIFIAVREHVINHSEDLQSFLDSHPLHHLYGGENAYSLAQYLSAIKGSGLKIIRKLATYDSDINLFPSSKEKIKSQLALNHFIFRFNLINGIIFKFYNFRHKNPGRLYSFIAYKP
jgi:ubiquinone/menaquinone biosynthesis C-methylase UbiE